MFRKWFDDAVAAGLKESNAMALSANGKYGFVWYTNYESWKALRVIRKSSCITSFLLGWASSAGKSGRLCAESFWSGIKEILSQSSSRKSNWSISQLAGVWFQSLTLGRIQTSTGVFWVLARTAVPLAWQVGIFPSTDQWKTILENRSVWPWVVYSAFFTAKFTNEDLLHGVMTVCRGWWNTGVAKFALKTLGWYSGWSLNYAHILYWSVN